MWLNLRPQNFILKRSHQVKRTFAKLTLPIDPIEVRAESPSANSGVISSSHDCRIAATAAVPSDLGIRDPSLLCDW